MPSISLLLPLLRRLLLPDLVPAEVVVVVVVVEEEEVGSPSAASSSTAVEPFLIDEAIRSLTYICTHMSISVGTHILEYYAICATVCT